MQYYYYCYVASWVRLLATQFHLEFNLLKFWIQFQSNFLNSISLVVSKSYNITTRKQSESSNSPRVNSSNKKLSKEMVAIALASFKYEPPGMLSLLDTSTSACIAVIFTYRLSGSAWNNMEKIAKVYSEKPSSHERNHLITLKSRWNI